MYIKALNPSTCVEHLITQANKKTDAIEPISDVLVIQFYLS